MAIRAGVASLRLTHPTRFAPRASSSTSRCKTTSFAPSVDHDLRRILRLDAVALGAQDGTERLAGVPKGIRVLCLQHDVAYLGGIGGRAALPHPAGGGPHLRLVEIDRGQ